MTFLRGVFKITFFLLSVILFLFLTGMARVLIWSIPARSHFYTAVVAAYCRFGLWFLNIDLKVINTPAKGKNYLLICNHLGILDIIIMAAIQPCLFITSVEMKNTPGLGLLCEMGGCLFVERRDRSNIHKEIRNIRMALQQKLNVTLYPEGTSTNGERVLPFKKSLLTAAAGTGVPILPMVLNYTHVNGEPISAQNRDQVFWYGDQAFPPILWKLLTNRSVRVEAEFFEEIHVTSEEQRREVAARAQSLIESKFRPIPS